MIFFHSSLLNFYNCRKFINVMRKSKANKLPTQVSKISDFFSKAPVDQRLKNGTCNNKRTHDTTDSTQNIVLNSVTNHPGRSNHKTSPTYKKIKHDENFVPPTLANTQITESQTHCRNVGNTFQIATPEKGVRPSSSMKTPTPKKNAGSGSSSGKSRTPQSSKKGTPKKLFEKSPRKLEEFNVQLLEAFVNISPSTSNKKIKMTDTPSKKCVQSSIKKYVSPITSNRFSPAQNYNETTPSKSPKLSSSSFSPKVRTKLNFVERVDVPMKEVMDQKNCVLSSDIKLEIDTLLEDEFNELLSFEDDLSGFNLNEPQRCAILEINRICERVDLKLKSLKNSSIGFCSIEEFWASGDRFAVGDIIYINAEKVDNKWVVNNTKGWLVYEPDLLIPCTSVVGSLFCKRKGILANRFHGVEPGNRIMLIGVLTHSLLQQALKNKLKTAKEIEALLRTLLQSKDTMKKLYESNLTYEEIEPDLQVFVPKLVSFISDYLDPNSQIQASNWQGTISAVDDIEENFWCPDLGTKGKIDVTVQTGGGTVPLELKTGRATVSLEHRGQVVLYIMMMNKFGYEVSSGLLLYLREGVLKEIKATPQERRDVMILRNELAYFLVRNEKNSGSRDILKAPELPEPLYNHRACAKCPYSVLCTSYLKFEDQDISSNKTIKEVQKTVTSHLTQSHLDYFLRWSNLLGMEQESSQGSKSVKEIYTVPPAKRETSGRCISNVKIEVVGDDQNGLYEHTFAKENSDSKLTSYDIVENNYVVVSTDSRPAVATGFVSKISSSKISVLLDRLQGHLLQTFVIMAFTLSVKRLDDIIYRNLSKKYQDQFLHIDTYDSNNTFTYNMTSLALLLENTPRAAELRDIIIDKKPPTFQSKLPSVVAKKGAAILKRLNIVQQKAVLKGLCANQFLLIKGMPGTGKSATIVALIQLLVELDKSVLITSHTHSAIDNICTRLQKRGVDFLRLGSGSKIDPNLKPNSEAALTEGCKSPRELEEVYNKYKVLASTCLGSGHPLLSKRTLDVCIVDESTQVLQTSILKPLFAAKTFILIGDPNQLAPLVRNRNANKAGMSESLFERLENSDGTIVLNLNYRMNQTITDLANVLTYKGELKPGNEEVAKRTLQIRDIEFIRTTYGSHPWLLKAMDTSLNAAVQLIDTGPVWQQPEDIKWHFKRTKVENGDVQNCLNFYEIAVVVTLVKALIQGGVPNNDIGVIATYRAQVTQISDLVEALDVDVSTVDQFQGRDKSVVIYSCTKSTDPSKKTDPHKSELLEDKRRLTVAITRAKRKLLIVGDVSTLQKFSTFSIILPALKNNIIKFDSQWSLLNNF